MSRCLLLMLVCVACWAEDWHVLIIRDLPATELATYRERVDAFNQRCAASDALPAYFAVIETKNGGGLLVYGWVPPVTGLRLADFPNLLAGIQRRGDDHGERFTAAHWETVGWLRERMKEQE